MVPLHVQLRCLHRSHGRDVFRTTVSGSAAAKVSSELLPQRLLPHRAIALPATSWKRPTLGANPYSEVMSPFCRLPLPTLILINQGLITPETCCGMWYGHGHTQLQADNQPLPTHI